MKLYPAIDLLEGACVRLQQGEFSQKTIYSADPIATLRHFEHAGAEYLHVVDLSGAKDPARRQLPLLRQILHATSLKVQLGGGIRSASQADELLDSGADRVVIGSAALANPALVIDLARRWGGERLTLALDVRIDANGRASVAQHGWQSQTGLSIAEALAPFQDAGLTRILCTDIGRDGMMTGPNLALYQAMTAELAGDFGAIDIQASGGIRHLDDLLACKAAGMQSAIVGKALYEGALKLSEALKLC